MSSKSLANHYHYRTIISMINPRRRSIEARRLDLITLGVPPDSMTVIEPLAPWGPTAFPLSLAALVIFGM